MSKGEIIYHSPHAGASGSSLVASSGAALRVADPAVRAQAVPLPDDVASMLPGEAGEFARRLVRLALDEDGPDLTALGVFPPDEQASARIVAKQNAVVAGLPLISLVFAELGMEHPAGCWEALAAEGSRVRSGDVLARLWGTTAALLKIGRAHV